MQRALFNLFSHVFYGLLYRSGMTANCLRGFQLRRCLPLCRRGHKVPEQRMGPVGPGLQLRVELHPHKPGVAGQLHNLCQLPVGGQPGQNKTGSGDRLPKVVVELIAVPVALADLQGAVGGKGPAFLACEPAGKNVLAG